MVQDQRFFYIQNILYYIYTETQTEAAEELKAKRKFGMLKHIRV